VSMIICVYTTSTAHCGEFIVICLPGIGYSAKILELQTGSRVFECNISKLWNIPPVQLGLQSRSFASAANKDIVRTFLQGMPHVRASMYAVRFYLYIGPWRRLLNWTQGIAIEEREGKKKDGSSELPVCCVSARRGWLSQRKGGSRAEI